MSQNPSVSQKPVSGLSDMGVGDNLPPGQNIQAILSSEQFRKVENMQRYVNKLSRRVTTLTLLNLLLLGLVGGGFYLDHQKLVDGYVHKWWPAGTAPRTAPTPAPAPEPVHAAAPSASSATPAATPPAPPPAHYAPPVPDPKNVAAAQKLFDQAKILEIQGNYTEAVALLEKIQVSYSSPDWPKGLNAALARVRSAASEQSSPGFFGVR